MAFALATRPVRRRWKALIGLAIFWMIWTMVTWTYNYTHPSLARDVRRLHNQAKSYQRSKLYWQSTSLKAARKEYRRRYSIAPPPGYDAWYEFAKERDSLIIDHFDDIMFDLRPYRGFHQGKCDLSASSVVSDDIVRVCSGNDLVGVDGSQKDAVNHMVELMESVAEDLPDMCVVMNVLGQPRVVIPHSMISSLYGPMPPKTCEVQVFQKFDKLNIWDQSTKSCPHDSYAREPRGMPIPKNSIQLVRNWTEESALCHKPSAPLSGLISSPEYARISNVVRPILSSSTLSTFNDIRVPGELHFAGADDEPDDTVPWEEKEPLLAWRGDSSGGFALGENWRDFQRQRMVALSEGKDRDVAAPKRKGGSRNDIEAAPRVQKRLDIHFNNITSCEFGACQTQLKELGVKEAERQNVVLDKKLVLSMDGAGADGRLYKLLKSNSAVVRQGILREWHDSRLIPWLHFIPLSMEADELSDLLDFLLGDGDDIAQSIAEAGQEWAERALRKDDMDIYLYRLLLEVGRRDA